MHLDGTGVVKRLPRHKFCYLDEGFTEKLETRVASGKAYDGSSRSRLDRKAVSSYP
jgi:hypothetical protein